MKFAANIDDMRRADPPFGFSPPRERSKIISPAILQEIDANGGVPELSKVVIHTAAGPVVWDTDGEVYSL